MHTPKRTYKIGHEPIDELAWAGGNVPDAPEPEPTLRGEIATAVEMVAKADAIRQDIVSLRVEPHEGLVRLRRQFDSIFDQLTFIDQLAENVK